MSQWVGESLNNRPRLGAGGEGCSLLLASMACMVWSCLLHSGSPRHVGTRKLLKRLSQTGYTARLQAGQHLRAESSRLGLQNLCPPTDLILEISLGRVSRRKARRGPTSRSVMSVPKEAGGLKATASTRSFITRPSKRSVHSITRQGIRMFLSIYLSICRFIYL